MTAFFGYSKTIYAFAGHILPLSQYTIYVSYGESSWSDIKTAYVNADAIHLDDFGDVPFIYSCILLFFIVTVVAEVSIIRVNRKRTRKP